MGRHANRKDSNKLLTRLTYKWSHLSKTDKVINITMITTIGIIFVGCLIAFVPGHFNRSRSQIAISSATTSSKKKNVQSSHRSNNKEKEGSIAESDVVIAKNADSDKKPNAGKVLYFNTTDEANAAIKAHEASCPYEPEPFYPGRVYTGTYTCKCGLKIIWWDQALKEGFDTGHSDDPRVKAYIGDTSEEDNTNNGESSSSSQEEYSDDTDSIVEGSDAEGN